jgi:DNA-binding transcriptional MerR regulator
MAEVVDIREYTVEAVCSTVHVTPAMLRRYRLAGIVAPVRTTAHGARYDEAAVMRLRTVRRLMRDLGTNLAGAQVALHLLDQLAEAHREIARLRAQLAERHSPHAGDSA